MDARGSDARRKPSVGVELTAEEEEEWDGSRWAGFKAGYSDAETFLRLLRRLPKAAKYRSDCYSAYSLPPPVPRVNGKESEVNRNEGLHSKLRARLNRLVRRTHGYSKRQCMLIG